MQITDPMTQLLIGDTGASPFPADYEPDQTLLAGAFSTLILSASGWRKIFAADGNEESTAADVAPEDRVLAAAMAKSFADFLKKKSGDSNPSRARTVVLGIDARYTGPVLASVMIRTLLAEGMSIRYLFIVAAPELMAYVRNTPGLDGFIYISASHNPVGHNGVKFGLTDGGVLGGEDAAELIEAFQKLVTNRDDISGLCRKTAAVDAAAVEEIFRSVPEWKRDSAASYYRFSKQSISNSAVPEEQDIFFRRLDEAAQSSPFGIVGELNGSARGTSIDRDIFHEAGFQTAMYNDRPRQIVHRIVPEGRSLDLCREKLTCLAGKNTAFQLGYVPDNDGDRGNLVYYDSESGEAKIIEAQEVFALAVLGELSFLCWSGGAPLDDAGRFTGKVAVAVNGPTSRRIDRIAEVFGAKVFRAEVGEANAVNLARRLRKEGYIVRILGEGSNGGNITHPSAVRDPLNTIFAAAKLLCLRGPGRAGPRGADPAARPDGPFGLWLGLSGKERAGLCGPDKDGRVTLGEVLKSLPQFITTSAYEPEAIMRIRTTNHAALKANYETVFTAQWAGKKAELEKKYGIVSFREINTEGSDEKFGFGPEYRSGKQKGGLKIQLYRADSRPAAYIWMRGSGTEPVFRVLADVEGDDPQMERELLSWQREMIETADKSVY